MSWWKRKGRAASQDDNVLMILSHAEGDGVRHSVMNPTDRVITNLDIDGAYGRRHFDRLDPMKVATWWEPNTSGYAEFDFNYDITRR